MGVGTSGYGLVGSHLEHRQVGKQIDPIELIFSHRISIQITCWSVFEWGDGPKPVCKKMHTKRFREMILEPVPIPIKPKHLNRPLEKCVS
jgi:hypothetical protein